MKSLIFRCGLGLAVRIPRRYVKELRLEEGAEADLIPAGDGLLLRLRRREYKLSDLLDAIKPENIHSETDWGCAAGREIW